MRTRERTNTQKNVAELEVNLLLFGREREVAFTVVVPIPASVTGAFDSTETHQLVDGLENQVEATATGLVRDPGERSRSSRGSVRFVVAACGFLSENFGPL